MVERLLYVMVFLALGFVLFSSTDSEKPADPACANSSTAWSMTKSVVRQHLGYPLSVRFPDPFASSGVEAIKFRYLGDCRHRIVAFTVTDVEEPPRRQVCNYRIKQTR